MDKLQWQSAVADGKSVNARVDQTVTQRSSAHKPVADPPWKTTPIGKSIPNERSTIFKK